MSLEKVSHSEKQIYFLPTLIWKRKNAAVKSIQVTQTVNTGCWIYYLYFVLHIYFMHVSYQNCRIC